MVETTLKKVFYITNYVKNDPKMVTKCQNYRKGGKKFQIFEIFSINSKKYKSFETFTHLSSDFELQIPGDPAGRIHNRFF